jgi:2-polyprenyl-6-methoxyphenol hydroxylase-like FAD-dependent oxidoreductase
MTRARTAAVIGGGIAGPVAALALRRAGIEATVYEGHAGPADGLGGTIGLAPNGVAALEIVGIAPPASQAADRQVMAVGGKRVELPAVGPMQVVRRADLYRALNDAVGDVRTGWQLTDVRADGTAVFGNGQEVRADVLIGADGVHSTVRRLIDPAAPGPRYTGMLSFEGVSDFAVPEPAGTMTFAFGRKGYYLYWPAPGGGTTFGVNLPSRDPLTIAEARAVPSAEWLEVLARVYGEDRPGGDLVRHLAAEALQVNGALHIMPPVPRWHRDRMVLTGDAVHAPSNSSGQGASLAIESAIQLARCLRDIDEVPEAFATYERLRRPRVQQIAAQAARINQKKTPGRLAQALMPLLMPLFLRMAANREKILDYRINFEEPIHKYV